MASTTASTRPGSPPARPPTSRRWPWSSTRWTGWKACSTASPGSAAGSRPRPTGACSRHWCALTRSITATSSATCAGWSTIPGCGPSRAACTSTRRWHRPSISITSSAITTPATATSIRPASCRRPGAGLAAARLSAARIAVLKGGSGPPSAGRRTTSMSLRPPAVPAGRGASATGWAPRWTGRGHGIALVCNPDRGLQAWQPRTGIGRGRAFRCRPGCQWAARVWKRPLTVMRVPPSGSTAVSVNEPDRTSPRAPLITSSPLSMPYSAGPG